MSLLLISSVAVHSSFADNHYLTVGKDGNFKTISQAVSSLPMFNYERVVIYVENGTYNEKIKIDRDYVTIMGQNRDSTIIIFPQLRTDWIKNPDSIGPAVVNIHADDIVLENLTIENSQPEIGPHAFAVYGDGTRTIVQNCNLLSKGGDTFSLWNYKSGMYYCSNCTFEGSVDCVCPRGWCFIRDSKFIELKEGSATIWHAGGYDRSQKFVIANSSFDGVNGFELGRHHYEAQFYLLNCTFSDSMADRPIYRVVYQDSSENRPFNWGERDYYYNCHRGNLSTPDSLEYSWYAENLASADGSPMPGDITPYWTFGGKWDPESTTGVRLVDHELHMRYVLLNFPEPMTVVGKPILVSANGTRLTYDSGAGSKTLRFDAPNDLTEGDIEGLQLAAPQSPGEVAKVTGTGASLNERDANFDTRRE